MDNEIQELFNKLNEKMKEILLVKNPDGNSEINFSKLSEAQKYATTPEEENSLVEIFLRQSIATDNKWGNVSMENIEPYKDVLIKLCTELGLKEIINPFLNFLPAFYNKNPNASLTRNNMIDLNNLYANDEIQRFGEGEMSMTDGMRRAGAITKMVNNILSNIASTKMGCMVTNHVYATTDMYSDDVIPGGQKLIFLTTQILQMNKLKLKAKDVEGGVEGAADSDVVGIRSKCKVYKSNWNKCFESVEVQIPYTTGMNPYSGLFDLFEAKGLLVKEGNQYVYKSPKDGKEVFKKFRKNITNEDYDLMMKDFMEVSQSEKTVDQILKTAEKKAEE